jgi:predicted phage terminase large subunit-like protein
MLFAKYGGAKHEDIEREMRAIGHHSFHRRLFYSRFERGRHAPGWIEKYGFDDPSRQPTATEMKDWAAAVAIRRAAVRKDTVRTASGSDRVQAEHSATERTIERAAEYRVARGGSFPDESPVATALGSDRAEVPESGPVDTAPGSDMRSRRSTEKDWAEFQIWLERVSPNMQWHFKHQVYIYRKLRRFYYGDIDRLMLFVPPRHGKSELVTVRYAAWEMRQDPSKNIIIASYSQSLANRFSRKIKGVLADDWVMSQAAAAGNAGARAGKAGASGLTDAAEAQVEQSPRTSASRSGTPAGGGACVPGPYPNGSPFPFASKRRANSDAEWETSLGGGLRAVGVGGGVTGFGADLIIVDDPIKSRAEAESATYRDRVWNWFNDDIYTRLEPDGKICLIQTRWHEDDLAGRLLREAAEGGEQWEVIDLPALAEGSKSEPPASAGGNEAAVHPTSVSEAVATGAPNVTVSETTTRSNLDNAEGTGVAGEGARAPVKPRVIGYPRLYSKLSEPPALAGGTNCDIELRAQNGDNVSVDPLNSHISTTPPLPPAHAGGPDRTDPLNREPGEPLWPERFPAEKLGRTRLKLGTYSFSALYQQRPVPADGGLFKREWFKIIPRAPHGLRWRRATDPGLTSSAKADYTASFRVAFDNQNNFYIDAGFRKQLEYPDLRRYVLGRMLAEKDTFEHGIERSAHGRALEQDLAVLPILRGKPLRGIDVKDGKVPRALPWIALAEQGKVFLTRGIWNRDFIDECLAFPLGTHDDQVDAVSLGFQMSRRTSSSLHRF